MKKLLLIATLILTTILAANALASHYYPIDFHPNGTGIYYTDDYYNGYGTYVYNHGPYQYIHSADEQQRETYYYQSVNTYDNLYYTYPNYYKNYYYNPYYTRTYYDYRVDYPSVVVYDNTNRYPSYVQYSYR